MDMSLTKREFNKLTSWKITFFDDIYKLCDCSLQEKKNFTTQNLSKMFLFDFLRGWKPFNEKHDNVPPKPIN